MKINIGIDASRNRSGGAKAHIIGILTELGSLPDEIKEIHIWSYKALLDSLPDFNWLIKHSPSILEKPLLHQIWWQYWKLHKEAKKAEINILLNTDAGTLCRFHPSITMSRDMLSYEIGEIKRYGIGLSRLRLFVLRYVQNYSLKNSEGAIFLTKYASRVIQEYCGIISNYTIIPHGVSKVFRVKSNMGFWEQNKQRLIKCIYVSNVDFYKHQWIVVKSIKYLRDKGYGITITFVGGGGGKAQEIFEKELQYADPDNIYVSQLKDVQHHQIPELLKEADIFIFASSCENMPNTLVEGMSSGLPIACSNRGPMPEVLLDGGIYFDPENYISIAEAIEELINNERLRVRVASIARNLSEKFNWQKCAKETFEFMVQSHNRYLLNKLNG